MKLSYLAVFALVNLGTSSVWALPQDFSDLSNLLVGNLPVDDRDLTMDLIAPALWQGEMELPGKWRDAYANGLGNDAVLVRHIAAAPTLFGHRPLGVEAVYQGKALERVSIYYLEAGTFFGYQPELTSSSKGQQTAQAGQRAFRQAYEQLDESLTESLKGLSENRGHTISEGATSMFKTQFRQFERAGLAMQLRTKKDFYVRVDLRNTSTVKASLLRTPVEMLTKRERVAHLKANVRTDSSGDVLVQGIPMIYQGGRAYCGITTFLMGAQYLGIEVDPATMASVAGFRYGQGGKKMIEAYSAVAKEGAVRMSRSTKVDPDRVRKSLDAGFPVLVWRHYDADRNRLHAMAARAPGLLPPPDEADRATWPTGNAPAHSSLITGYNADTGEVIFAESWGEHARGKRMLMEEIEATAYYIFYYSI